ncbi:MAG TPA: DUF4124 domain-containing protein [Usitatibacter sp.]
MHKKICAARNATAERPAFGIRGARASALAMSLTLALAGGAAAQGLYKWIDADGKTQYSDKPPKNFKGTLTRIAPDEQPATMAPYRAPAPAAATQGDGTGSQAPDPAMQRRELRGKLGAAVEIAREKVAAAKSALDAAGSPRDDEHQVIQQRVEQGRPAPGDGSASTGGMFGSGGMMGSTARSNCATVKSDDGRVVTTCPTIVPNDAYYDRIKKLEDDMRAAEAELAAAQLAYRRGVD